MFESTLEIAKSWLQSGMATIWLKAFLLFIIGLFLARVVSGVVGNFTKRFWEVDSVILVKRLVFWAIFGIIAASALKMLGFDLGVLLGAAGILTVAIGFASQTSASNLISGLFLSLERSFKVGDAISIGTTTGEVLSIDLLSVKLRTFDNRFVRVPNEAMVKSDFTNLTRFPIRRADVLISVAYKEDLSKVKSLLFELANDHIKVLDEPKPVFYVLGFGASGIDLQFSCWTEARDFYTTKSELYEEVKFVFDREKIEIPFPHMSIYAGEDSKPIRVKLEK